MSEYQCRAIISPIYESEDRRCLNNGHEIADAGYWCHHHSHEAVEWLEKCDCCGRLGRWMNRKYDWLKGDYRKVCKGCEWKIAHDVGEFSRFSCCDICGKLGRQNSAGVIVRNDAWDAYCKKEWDIEKARLCVSCWNKARPIIRGLLESVENRKLIERIKKEINGGKNHDKRAASRISGVDPSRGREWNYRGTESAQHHETGGAG